MIRTFFCCRQIPFCEGYPSIKKKERRKEKGTVDGRMSVEKLNRCCRDHRLNPEISLPLRSSLIDSLRR